MGRDPFSWILVNGSLKTVPRYIVKYSPDVLKKKTKVLDIFNSDKTCFLKNNLE
jgi:hypothetical protein